MKTDLPDLIERVPPQIKRHFIVRQYDRGATVIFPGESNDYLYLLTQGSVEVCMQTYQGVNISLNAHTAPDAFGVLEIFDRELRTKSVIAGSRCTVISLKRQYVLQWMKEDFDFNLFLIGLLSLCFRQANRSAVTLAGLTIKERVLLSIYNHFRAGDLEHLSKKVLIQEVCAPMRSMNRSLAQCIDEKLISYEGRKIRVLDEKTIAEIVEEYL